MTKLLILGAYGQIARIIEDRVLNEDTFQDIELTLFLRNSSRLNNLADYGNRVHIIEGDINNADAVSAAMKGQDIVFVATVDTDSNNTLTKNVISGMKANNITRVIAASSIGIYNEEPNPKFAKWNQSMLSGAIPAMRQADELLHQSGLNFTTTRFGWLTNDSEINYDVTKKGEKFAGVSGSRKSMADAVLTIISDSSRYENETIGIANPDTKNDSQA